MNRIRDKPPAPPAVTVRHSRLLRHRRSERIRFLLRLSALITLSFALVLFVICPIPQHGSQMAPAVRDGDLVITCRIRPTYQSGVLVGYRDAHGKRRLGRIIALEHETVDLTEDGRVQVNGLELGETVFFRTEAAEESAVTFPYTVPKGCFFILNDHRAETDDSRMYGAIRRKRLLGSAVSLYRRREF